MDINIQIALEKLKTGDIKSAMDQLRFVSTEIALLNNQVADLYTELQKKVNLTSEKLNGSIAVTKLGSGTVSTDDVTVIGVGTLFNTDCTVGNIIKIGTESASISSIDSDTVLTVDASFTTMTDQLYAITKNATQDLLVGDYQYGELNGDPYNGVITQGSTLQQYGRMTNPQDVVNVQFVQRATNPAMARALNAIQRDGDTVGLATGSTRYDYLFRNVNMVFGDPLLGNSDVKYYGTIAHDNNVPTKKYVDDLLVATSTKRFLRTPWYEPGHLFMQVADITKYNCTDITFDTATEEFTIDGSSGIEHVVLLVGHARVSWTMAGHDGDNRCRMTPYINSIAQLSFEHTGHLATHANEAGLGEHPLVTCSIPLVLKGGDKIKFIVIPLGVNNIPLIQWSLLFI